MTTIAAPPRPAVLTALADGRDAVTRAAEAAAWSLTDDELVSAVTDTVALAAQVEGTLLLLLAEADSRDLAGRTGAPSTAA